MSVDEGPVCGTLDKAQILGVPAGCLVLEGATAYVGFDICKDAHTNYWRCDGVADDVQINAAEAYVTGLGGGTVEMERGTYTLADPIIPTGNAVWYKGQGRDTFIDGDGLATTEHAFHVTGRDDIKITDLSIQTQDGGGKTCYCIFIEDGSDRFQIRNVWIIESDTSGIHIEGTTMEGGYIENCHIFGADGDGIGIYMDAANYMRRLHITGCDIIGCGANGIDGATCAGNNYWVIAENMVRGCTAYGIFLRDGDYSVITNNISYNNEWNGIYVIDSDHVTVSDNESYYNGRMGIYLHNSDDCIVEGNQCIENDRDNAGLYDGIYVDGDSDDNLILGNKCDDNDRYGINVAGARNRVKENDFSGNTAGAFNDGGADTRVHYFWEKPPNTDSNIGDHPAQQMQDGVDTYVRSQTYIPLEYQELVTAQIVVAQGTAANPNMVWTCDMDWGKVCSGEDYFTHTDSAGATTALAQDDLVCLDISGGLDGIAPGDLVGVSFMRDGDAGGDTVGGPVYYLGIRVRYV